MTCGYAGGVDGINTLPPCRRPDGMGALLGSATHPEGPDDLMFSGGQCGGGHRAQITSRARDENLQYLFLRSLNLCLCLGELEIRVAELDRSSSRAR
jgi:hypothetical protein